MTGSQQARGTHRDAEPSLAEAFIHLRPMTMESHEDTSGRPASGRASSGGAPSPDELVRQLIDGELEERREADALHRIADDADARSILRFQLQWTPEISRHPEDPDPPDGFADAVMEQTARATEPTSGASTGGWREHLRRWLQPLITPRTIAIRPGVALALALAALIGLTAAPLSAELGLWPTDDARTSSDAASATTASGAPAATTPTQRASGSSVVWTRFVFTSEEASSVAVAGDFSQWEPIPLSPRTVGGQTVWTGLVPVGRGEHEYQFVIDGSRWVTDPLAPLQRDDGFGAKNAVLKL